MRQTGSSFKPIVLAEALAQGIPAREGLRSACRRSPCPCPTGRSRGWWATTRARAGRRRTWSTPPSTRSTPSTPSWSRRWGRRRRSTWPMRLGINGPLKPYPSAVLGSNEVSVLDMASAYSTFAADGMHADPVFVTEITRVDGSVLYRRPSTLHRAVPAEVARGVTGILSQVVQRGRRDGHRRPAGGPAGGRQDRHGQRVEGRLVRRLHARPRHRRVGRLSRAAAVDGPAGDPHPGDGRVVAGPDLAPGDGTGAGRQPDHGLPGPRSGGAPMQAVSSPSPGPRHRGPARRAGPVRDPGPFGARGGRVPGRDRAAPDPGAGIGDGGRPDPGARGRRSCRAPP